jgi:hypothetical protein
MTIFLLLLALLFLKIIIDTVITFELTLNNSTNVHPGNNWHHKIFEFSYF